MAKTGLRARPNFHRLRDFIEARLTIVIAALAIRRHLEDATDVLIKKPTGTLRPLRTVQIWAASRLPDTDLVAVTRRCLS